MQMTDIGGAQPNHEADDQKIMTLARFRHLETELRDRGYGETIDWSEHIQPPVDADIFAHEVIYVICNSGMKATVARGIYNRCLVALSAGASTRSVFGHPQKAAAIDQVWDEREALFAAFEAADDPLTFCATLPYIGPVTQHHLAKNLGVDTIKPDVHLARLAAAEGVDAFALCRRLAAESGYRSATVDSILWRACADGLLDSLIYEDQGWRSALSVHSSEPSSVGGSVEMSPVARTS